MRRVRSQALQSAFRLGLLVVPLGVAGVVGVGGVAPASAAEPGQGRHYEMATPSDKLGQPVTVNGLSPDGSVVRFSPTGGNGLPGTGGVGPVTNSYLARRVSNRWEYTPMNLPTTTASLGLYFDATPSLDVQLFSGVTDLPTETAAFFLRRPGLPPEQITPDIKSRNGVLDNVPTIPIIVGASADLTRVLFTAERSSAQDWDIAYLPSDPPPEDGRWSPRKLYESVPGNPPTIRRVDVDNGGVPIGGACLGSGELNVDLGTVNQAERAVSENGRRIFFTTSPDCVDRRVYARVDGTTTIELSAPECDRVADPGAEPPVTACEPRSGGEEYQSAAADGHAVYFNSPNQLVDGDVDTTPDLYRYDFDAPIGARLRKVSAGTNATPEAGADLRGMVRMSADGDRAYFVAGAVLATSENARGQTAVAGENNLYRYDADSDTMHFVTTLDPAGDWAVYGGDAYRLAHLADPQGRYLVFASVARLTADDTDSSQDVYRYDADSGELLRVSVGQDGFGSDGNDEIAATTRPLSNKAMRVSVSSAQRIVSADGQRIVFSTTERLQADDVNDASDIYEWADGEVGLITDGTTEGGTPDRSNLSIDFMISADGSSVAFSTATRLLPDRDTDTANDVYVARLGSDVDPLPAAPPGPCVGDACQGASPDAPRVPGAGSVTFMGPSNRLGRLPQPRIAISKPKAIVGARGVLRIKVSGPGRLRVYGSGLKGATRTVTKRGTYVVRVALRGRLSETLERKGSVVRTVRAVFRSKGGSATKARRSVTFKASSSRKGR